MLTAKKLMVWLLGANWDGGMGHGASLAVQVGMGMGMKRVDQAISHLNN